VEKQAEAIGALRAAKEQADEQLRKLEAELNEERAKRDEVVKKQKKLRMQDLERNNSMEELKHENQHLLDENKQLLSRLSAVEGQLSNIMTSGHYPHMFNGFASGTGPLGNGGQVLGGMNGPQ